MKYDTQVLNILEQLPKRIEDLELDEEESIGYTYKAMAVGFWVLKRSRSFEEGILAIIHEGGDADTNASVGGAILGAKFGYSQISDRLKQGLVNRVELDIRISNLLKLMS